MWVTKLLISPVKKMIFCPKTTKFGPKLAFLVNLGQAMQAYSMPCCGSVGGCGARAVSRKTPIYFIYETKGIYIPTVTFGDTSVGGLKFESQILPAKEAFQLRFWQTFSCTFVFLITTNIFHCLE